MKIYQFTPNPLKKALEKNGPERAGPNTKAVAGPDFASVLKAVSPRPSPPAGSAGQIVSLENQRARDLPSPGDLGQAGLLLGRLQDDIRAASPAVLRDVHSLEGLVYIYAKSAH